MVGAFSLAASSYETCRSDYGADATVTLNAAGNLATILGSAGDIETATALARDTLVGAAGGCPGKRTQRRSTPPTTSPAF